MVFRTDTYLPNIDKLESKSKAKMLLKWKGENLMPTTRIYKFNAGRTKTAVQEDKDLVEESKTISYSIFFFFNSCLTLLVDK